MAKEIEIKARITFTQMDQDLRTFESKWKAATQKIETTGILAKLRIDETSIRDVMTRFDKLASQIASKPIKLKFDTSDLDRIEKRLSQLTGRGSVGMGGSSLGATTSGSGSGSGVLGGLIGASLAGHSSTFSTPGVFKQQSTALSAAREEMLAGVGNSLLAPRPTGNSVHVGDRSGESLTREIAKLRKKATVTVSEDAMEKIRKRGDEISLWGTEFGLDEPSQRSRSGSLAGSRNGYIALPSFRNPNAQKIKGIRAQNRKDQLFNELGDQGLADYAYGREMSKAAWGTGMKVAAGVGSAAVGAINLAGAYTQANTNYSTGLLDNRYSPFAGMDARMKNNSDWAGMVPLVGGAVNSMLSSGDQKYASASKAFYESQVGNMGFNQSARSAISGQYSAIYAANGTFVDRGMGINRSAKEDTQGINDRYTNENLKLTNEWNSLTTVLPTMKQGTKEWQNTFDAIQENEAQQKTNKSTQGRLIKGREEQRVAEQGSNNRNRAGDIVGMLGETQALGMDVDDKLKAAKTRLISTFDKQIEVNKNDTAITAELTKQKDVAVKNLETEFGRDTANMGGMNAAARIGLGGNQYGGSIAAIKETTRNSLRGISDPGRIKEITEAGRIQERIATNNRYSGIMGAKAQAANITAGIIGDPYGDNAQKQYQYQTGENTRANYNDPRVFKANQAVIDANLSGDLVRRKTMGVQSSLQELGIKASTKSNDYRFNMMNEAANVSDIIAGGITEITNEAMRTDIPLKQRNRVIQSMKDNRQSMLKTETDTRLYGGNGYVNPAMVDYVSARTQQTWSSVAEAKNQAAGAGALFNQAANGAIDPTSPTNMAQNIQNIWTWLQKYN